MDNQRKDSCGFGLQIEAPSPLPTKYVISSDSDGPNLPKPLTLDEKKYLLAVERGDLANVRRILQRAQHKKNLNVSCVDSLGRGALTLAIDGENLEMVELLIIMNVETKDALLQSINAEFVEAVELLLEHEELIHQEGEPYSWQKVDVNTAMFTPDVTPLILAAHKNNYEIIKILLDRGATLPMPHDVKCGCDDCIKKSSEDSLRHSLARVNEYRALASPSLIALSSNDPLLTAFQLSWELRNLAFAEQECKAEYLELRRQCQQFAVDLLDQSRSSQELAIILNYDPESPPYMDGDHMKLTRLELAINYKQKKFVAHPNIQQLLAAMWYEGVPGFRRKSASEKLIIILKTALLFPLYCMFYMIAPSSETGKFMRKPFMKFLIHASSYLFFLFILILVSQRAEVQLILLFGTDSMKRALQEELLKQRGNGPTYLELLVVIYVLGFIWEETQEIFDEGIRNYLKNMWNFIDFSRNFLYVMVILLRVVAYIQQYNEVNENPNTAFVPREQWDDFDPQLIAEGLFAAANIFSALKLVHLFSINPHLGPLQISLGRMVIDIVKFFFIYSLVLFAFACGLNQLLWYFADLEKVKCYSLPGGQPDWGNEGDACMKWRRFGNLFESSQSLFWASFGMVGLESFELTGIKTYTRFWGLLMFGSYCVINVIVLLNLLIAMMSNSYAMIEQHSDTEWKFARTRLWMSYFEESATLPPPFNIFPNVKHLMKLFRSKKKRDLKRESTIRRKEERERENRYTNVMRALVWRYVCSMHRRMEEDAVTEDDINEVKGEISAFRYEMLEIFEKSGMDVSSADRKEKTVLAKRMKVWERRLMKDFHVAPVDQDQDEPIQDETSLAKFRRVALKVAQQSATHKWGQVMEGVGVQINSQIGRCHNRQSFKNQQNLKRAMAEARRLVEKGIERSGSVTPIEFDDRANTTLMSLLKNISEELQEISPGNTISVPQNSKSRSTTPQLNNLTAQLQAVISQSTSPLPLKSNKNTMKPAKSASMETTKPSSPESSAAKSKTVKISPVHIPEKFRTVNLTASAASSGRKSPPPGAGGCVSSPPNQPFLPTIQVTRTESQIKKSASKENIDDDTHDDTVIKIDASPMKSRATTSPPKVVKRKAPAPATAEIARPVSAKPQPGQGMIPPPPSKADVAPASVPTISTIPPSPAPIRSETPKKTSRPPSPAPSKAAVAMPVVPKPVGPTESPKSAKSLTLDSSVSGSTEQLIQSPKGSSVDVSKAPASPACLRPIRKVEDVTTIKRQPKTGWL